MILTKQEIRMRIGQDIKIDPFDEKRLNPNSYNLSLHNELLVYKEYQGDSDVLDPKISNKYHRFSIPDDGFILDPGELYLARTVEYTETHNLVPRLEGRSSYGRLGLFVHVTAGFGDVGFCGHWTLELAVVRPLKIYPFTPICQIAYHTIFGAVEEYNSDKYQRNTDIQPSMIWKEFQNEAR